MKLFLIGAGKMATAIAGGLVKQKVFAASDMMAFDVLPQAAGAFTVATGVKAACGKAPEIDDAEAVLLAVKPQMLRQALVPLKGMFKEKLVISIVAGVKLETLAELTGTDRLVRVMPNTPALVGAGAACYAPGPGATEADRALVQKIFAAVGIALEVPEAHLDAVTALSGSGPAYVFEMIQAMADGGVACGLSRDAATRLSIQTVLGSALMAKETQVHPTVLKDQVTSPAGTTIRALEVLEDRGFAGAVIQAVKAACVRSEELGKK